MTETRDVADVVRTAWMDVLKVPHAEDDDNFFIEGGHSFAAVELMTQVESALDIEFPFDLLLSDGRLGVIVRGCESIMSEGATLTTGDGS